MKKFLVSALLFLLLTLTVPTLAHAQMMGNLATPTATAQTQTAQDEAAGKAIWDKLQNKEVTCTELTDDNFDVLGDFFMGGMMGSNHAAMNQMMTQRLGGDGEKQMHITLGKRLSGCNTNATFPQGAGYFTPMMGFSSGMMNATTNNAPVARGTYGMMGNWQGVAVANSFGIFRLLTWIALMTFLVSGSVFFLKELFRKKSK